VRMRQNLDATGGLIMAEAVMMALAPHLGRERAHDLVEAICRRMADGAEDFAACLAAEPEIATHLTANDIAEILRPESYIGNAEATIDAVLTRWRDTTTSAA